jgi:DNA replication and repair protein RecF
MKLRSISVNHFRNLTPSQLTLSERANVVVGENGQGKTNLLEAIYFLCTLKPLRASKLSELIAFGQGQASVAGDFFLSGAARRIAVEIEPKRRTALVDDKKTSSLENYFGGVSVVAFTPDDLDIVKGPPETRRNFVDRAVFNRFPAYLAENRDYVRALKNRNRLLKTPQAERQLDVWDELLSVHGARLWTRRKSVLAELQPRAAHAFARIGRIESPAQFSLQVNEIQLGAEPEASLVEQLRVALRARRSRDFERGFTSVGPHTDELSIQLGERAARAFASQGQTRALVLAFKIAEIENLVHCNGFMPMLLLDDVSSELDPERNAFLMQYLHETQAQTLLTTTDAQLVSQASAHDTVWFSMKSGMVERRP